MKTSRTLRWGSAALVAGMFVFGSSVALASVPDGNTIHACRKNSGGALRVIDTTQTCASTETKLDWSNWNFRGAWSSANAYKKGDVTTTGGSTFVATADIPVGGGDNWAVVALAGKRGAVGPAGPVGPKGVSTAYEAHCSYCNNDVAHDSSVWVTLLTLNLPAGKYAISAHAEIENRQVFDSERAVCAIAGRDESMVSLDSAGVGGNQTHAQVVLSTVGSFSGKVSLQCYADDSWHASVSTMDAVAVDAISVTNKP